MCGRVSLGELTASSIKTLYGVDTEVTLPKSYNVPPSSSVPAVRRQGDDCSLALLKWGLVPHWSKDSTIAQHTFNARLETLTQKPSFRESFRTKRCIVTVSGFYEWQKKATSKQPYYIHREDGQPLSFAGLWDQWKDTKTGTVTESCTIITTEATGKMGEIHHRMPAILEAADFKTWLDPHFKETHVLRDLLESREPALDLYKVSTYVSNVRNDGPKCVEQMSARQLF